ncbi:hypothetical protein HYY27_06590 [bacterium]|nr:hypothetical protein [bacterium]
MARRAVFFMGVLSLSFGLLRAQTAPRADFNGDGVVTFDDFFLFAEGFGARQGEARFSAKFDLDGKGSVDLEDFFLFAADFGKMASSGPSRTPGWASIAATSAGPPGRFDHTLTLDPTRNRLVVFGGRAPSSLGDTWVFDLDSRSWREVRASPSPPARHGHTAIYDAPRGRVVIFCGQSSAGFFNDVWAFDLGRETWQELVAAGDRPTVRYGSSAVFDAPRNRMVISHGFTSQGRFDDTWAFDLGRNVWTDLTPASGLRPVKRCLHEAVYDAGGDRMLLFGGCASGFGPCPLGDLWAFDLRTNVWTELRPSGAAPGARTNPALAYDPAVRRALLIGGSAAEGLTNDTWTFDAAGGAWTKLTFEGSIPAPRYSHDAVVDSTNARVLLFGGHSTKGFSDELWELKF